MLAVALDSSIAHRGSWHWLTEVARLALQMQAARMECADGMPTGLLFIVPVSCKEVSVDQATSDYSG